MYYLPNIVRVIKSKRLRWARHVARMRKGKSAFKILIGTDTERRWEENITKDLKEIGINTRNWVDLAKERDYCRALVSAALNLQVS